MVFAIQRRDIKGKNMYKIKKLVPKESIETLKLNIDTPTHLRVLQNALSRESDIIESYTHDSESLLAIQELLEAVSEWEKQNYEWKEA